MYIFNSLNKVDMALLLEFSSKIISSENFEFDSLPGKFVKYNQYENKWYEIKEPGLNKDDIVAFYEENFVHLFLTEDTKTL